MAVHYVICTVRGSKHLNVSLMMDKNIMEPVSGNAQTNLHPYTVQQKTGGKACKDDQAYKSPEHTGRMKSTVRSIGFFSAEDISWQSACYKTDVCLCKTKTKEVAEIGF